MYSPKIDEKLIPELYSLGIHFHKPMTFIVNSVLRFAITHFNNHGVLLGNESIDNKSSNAMRGKRDKHANNTHDKQ
jgi:hypothetical protein